ncbi:hypothetical protein [Streptomyces sp. NPDC018031]|uniref:hypothetical protein n=1 Tax=Streptomyces sp. NPDC018031 TaxID=3365033 RepID=UPI00379AFDA3
MHPEPDATREWLTRISLAAGIAFTATAEYELARTLGAEKPIAVMLPLAIDAYVVAALRWFRPLDIALSLTLMGAAQVAAHLLDAEVVQVDIPMVVVVSLLVPVAIWRTHALARDATHPARPGPDPAPAAEPAQHAPQAPVIMVPLPVPHTRGEPSWKAAPMRSAAPPPEPAPEPTVADYLARQHRVRVEQIRAVAALLDADPNLSGKAAGEAIGTGDRYGRRVLNAAKELNGVRP